MSHGLAIRYLTVTEVHPPDTWVMDGTGDNFYSAGMHHVSFQLTSVLNPADRTVSFTGAGEILPGPGKFRGATGRFTFAGTRPAVGAGAITETITGWIRTPHLSRPKS